MFARSWNFWIGSGLNSNHFAFNFLLLKAAYSYKSYIAIL